MTENNRSTASELDGLPDVDRKETEEIIQEIEKDEKQDTDLQPKPEKEGEDPDKGKKPEEEKKPEPKPGEVKPDPKPEPERKAPGLMPRWVHEAAKKDFEKTIGDLKTALEKASGGKGPEEAPKDRTPEQQNDLKSKVEKIATTLAEKHKGISKELLVDLATSMVELGITNTAELPADVKEKLKAVDEFKATQEIQAEESAFNAAFDEHVLPLIKKEYGDQVGADAISEIRELMKQKAYSDEFAKTPYGVIYKSVDDFRSFKRTPAKSAETSRGGEARNDGGEAEGDDASFENVTEEDIDKMDAPTFDRYTAWAEKKEKERR